VEVVISTYLPRRQVLRILRQLLQTIENPGGAGGHVRTLLVRLGLTALAFIRIAFVQKAAGGTDAAGESWKPLSPYTIAYSRRHPGLPVQRGHLAPSAALTAVQRARWWEIYRRSLARYRGSKPERKAHAAATAWHVLKLEGAETLLQRYGGTSVEILRDTGRLLESLTPGANPNQPPTAPPPVRDQVFRLERGAVLVGTQRAWAHTHHEGVPGHIPQRRLWPRVGMWPAAWWKEIAVQGRMGIIEIISYLLRR
jgi:hypothetical protein